MVFDKVHCSWESENYFHMTVVLKEKSDKKFKDSSCANSLFVKIKSTKMKDRKTKPHQWILNCG